MPEHQSPIDVHQHLWTEEFVDRLRSRSRAPYLRNSTLHTDGEPPYVVDPTGHDVATRIAADVDAGVLTSCLSLSSPLGIEGLLRPEATLLIDAWHRGVRALPDHFRAWASVPNLDPDISGLIELLNDDKFVGLQLPASELLSPAAWERHAQLLLIAELANKPVFIHPGPEERRPLTGRTPDWWAPVVGYVAQMQAAWWGWHAFGGRLLFPELRVVFGAGAGLAPLHHERHALRGGGVTTVDPLIFVDTSCTGTRALDSLVRVLGIDQLVLGSDRPYGAPLESFLGDAATHAVRVANPARLLGGVSTSSTIVERGELEWAIAS